MPSMKVERKCKIVSKDWLNQDAVYMVLEVGDMVRTSWKGPGQFVHVKCGDSLLLRRPISVCSCMEEEPEDTLAIVFEVRGEGTQWLANRPVGHSVDVMGLLGNGFSMKPEGRYLLVGGGIGVPPIRGCAQYTAKKSTAIVGFRSKEKAISLCVRELLFSIARSHKGNVCPPARQVPLCWISFRQVPGLKALRTGVPCRMPLHRNIQSRC